MALSSEKLILSSDDAIDLHLHTTYSDGGWTAEGLVDYLIAERFGIAAITDHDRVDTGHTLQELAAEKQFPLLVAVEMSSMWKGKLTDLLCYGYDPDDNSLDILAQDIARRQHENTRQVFNYYMSNGYPLDPHALEAMLTKPAAQQLPELLALAAKYIQDEKAIGRTLLEGGFNYMTQDPVTIVQAAHKSGAVCVLAHPGRSDGFVCYDHALLDEFRSEVKIDGIEAYYPMHTPEQTASYLDYAAQHKLLVSSGSDSHHRSKAPVKYPASNSRRLLERLGIEVQ